jgi:E3 ubiquitin-protein ligase NEDD4
MLVRIKLQLTELLRGFYDVVPEPLLAVFDFQELELLLHGLPHIEMDDWIKNTEFTGFILYHT